MCLYVLLFCVNVIVIIVNLLLLFVNEDKFEGEVGVNNVIYINCYSY